MLSFVGAALSWSPTGLPDWAPTGLSVNSQASINFTVSVQQQNLAALRAEALAVSTPGSDKYGKYPTKSAIDALTAPLESDMRAVGAWLSSNGISFTTTNELISASTTVANAEQLLATNFFEVTHPDHGKRVICGEYTIPSEVKNSIAGVFGLRGLPMPKRADLVQAGVPAKVTPAVLASTYSISGVTVKRGSGNTQAVAEFQGQEMSDADLQSFFKNEVPTAQAGDDKVSKYVGTVYKKGEGVEALLDVEFIMGVAPGIATQFWEWPNMDFCGDLLNFTSTLLASDVSVMSISYGWQGNLSKLNCVNNEVDGIDANWQKLALKGVSVLISSGDSGSGYTASSCDHSVAATVQGEVQQALEHFPSAAFCCQIHDQVHAAAWSFHASQHPNSGNCTLYKSVTGSTPAPKGSSILSGGKGISPAAHVSLFPSWPASSPWVTSVGATRFVGHTIGAEEMASDQFGSGGGFSSRFDQTNAPWQVDATAKYIAQGASLPKFPDASLFPAGGRGTPDVSALGEGYQVYVSGKVEPVGGTSASCPAFAGMISLINDARKQAGKPALGFLNPFLYKNADSFTDIVKGTNAIGRGTGPVPFGFAAAPGWDPATGLGTPVFSKLLAAAMA